MTRKNDEALNLVDDYIKTYTEMACATTTPHVTLNGFIRDLQAIRAELLPKPSIFAEDLRRHQNMLEQARRTCAYCGEDFIETDTPHILGAPIPTYYHTGRCFRAVLQDIDDNRQKEKHHDWN